MVGATPPPVKNNNADQLFFNDILNAFLVNFYPVPMQNEESFFVLEPAICHTVVLCPRFTNCRPLKDSVFS